MTSQALSDAGSIYDDIGRSYDATRRPDPRIAARLHAALGDARSVVNVGAGTGSYEPVDRVVVAVEPSAIMIARRPAGTAPVVQATAERLPFADEQFDAAMAVLTMHHWADPRRGVREMMRVARRVVILTWDVDAADTFWLMREYFPSFAEVDRQRFLTMHELERCFDGAAVHVASLPIPHDCHDGFLAAFWRRPEAYLDPAVQAGISSFAQAGDAVESGLRRLADDLESGAWYRRHEALLACDSMDFGYRIVVADLQDRA